MKSVKLSSKGQHVIPQNADIILSFVNLIDLHFPSEEIFTKAIDIYKQTSLDITDTFLYLKAKEENQKLSKLKL
ncbi:hypothetical protein COV24_03090 [candidate division WWE3 bacterium CG10_big_fil_rev_8_21_14_0_10_32_10]|uniref:Uncharacterized protein n=1 Tax=candidate division WWE3 bacterium CG10_big_fil_rev_8_21_14_0_10_32_10 TaxID=1975090 RepID=A0A2H0RC52_UNCKA|nr:MAG: hypothetical protein COV24_03090 [candidate division WWE3 bacterium CG10_big_fil_rev_8_21_14_0_10_32_10]